MKVLAPVSLALAATLALAASAGGQPAPAKPAAKPAPSCFWVRDVNGFNAPDDKTLYVRVGVSQIYKLSLFGNCMEIGWVHHVGLATHGMSDICEGTNPAVDVIDRELGVGRERCPVTDVQKLTPEQVAALPKSQRP
ncbi:MAG TPA: DUF6491 family protein [Caulobacteraceae bacterium]|nr:DUF6491 family protein [Caulobacteraceae bacterium]